MPRFTLVLLLCVAACSPADPTIDDNALGERSAAVAAVGPPGTWQLTPVARRSSWQYDASGVDRGTGWRTYHYGEWASGAAPLGYGEGYLATTLSYGSDPAHKPLTAYFRNLFAVGPHVKKVYLRVMYDDGFVFYINGKEGGRANMPGGPITFTTPALAGGHEALDRYETFDITSQLGNMVPGDTGTLAFEVHQANPSSSDLVFDAELLVWNEDPGFQPSGVAKGGYWTFWDRGGDLGSAWRAPDFDASSWSTAPGPVGFGESYIVGEVAAGPITTYLRGTLDFTGSVDRILADVMYDDGFVAYLNGHEIARIGLPAGTIHASTLAVGHEAEDRYETFDWTAAAKPYLVQGKNVLAVEVHQGGTASSDLVWDLGLEISGGWHPQHAPDQALNGVAFLDASHGFAVGLTPNILETRDGGATWSTRATDEGGSLFEVRFADDALNGWISGYGGAIYRTEDGGATWVSQRIPDVTVSFTGLWITGPQSAWLVGYSPDPVPKIRHTVDGGATWTPVQEPEGEFRHIAMADEQHGWIVGWRYVQDELGNIFDDRGVIYGTSDGGATWTEEWQAPYHYQHLYDVEVIDAQTAWAVGEGSTSGVGGVLLVTHDGGASWQEVESPATMGLTAIDFVDASHGWAVGDGGQIIATSDGGATWRVQESADRYEKPWLIDVSFAGTQNGWAAGSWPSQTTPGPNILHTTSGGE